MQHKKFDFLCPKYLHKTTIEIGFSKEHNYIKSTEIAVVKINSTQLCENLLSLGVTPNKSMNKIFPNIHCNLYHHFICGYFDEDGSICNSI